MYIHTFKRRALFQVILMEYIVRHSERSMTRRRSGRRREEFIIKITHILTMTV